MSVRLSSHKNEARNDDASLNKKKKIKKLLQKKKNPFVSASCFTQPRAQNRGSARKAAS